MALKGGALKAYADSLDKTITLRKKIIKIIMKSKEPLSQSELKDILGIKDWTNLRRALKSNLDEGIIAKKPIGKIDYYAKVEDHEQVQSFKSGDIEYFFDIFEPNFEGDERYLRIKQIRWINKEKYEILGKITYQQNDIKEVIEKLKKAEKKIKDSNS